MAQYIISIIIPVLNEAAIIKQTLWVLQKNSGVEIIVVDGGSKDNTVQIAQQTGVKVISVAEKGRSGQMNAGANIAQGNILLFLHIDTQLPPNFLNLVVKTLKQPEVIAGAFELAIEGDDRSLRWIEMLVKMRSRFLSLPYGDQAIFTTKQVFADMGGFSDLPIMEDFELVQRLKRQGKIAIAPAAVTTSGRRWQNLGVWKTTLINQLVILGYYLGISPTKLRNFYRGREHNK
ncbi:MAG: TIGR04283 family arsenosugar biosynthesis glycosyltransferase [Pleurocapsa sp. MO_192.B19]|nr:TIGR04283 family arsenosugar biosynthesis glycosyltransferase [Pleurocapsa sp. MO_192.B19]